MFVTVFKENKFKKQRNYNCRYFYFCYERLILKSEAYLNIIISAIPAVLNIEILESKVYNVIFVDFYQPLAILSVRIILRVIGRVNDA